MLLIIYFRLPFKGPVFPCLCVQSWSSSCGFVCLLRSLSYLNKSLCLFKKLFASSFPCSHVSVTEDWTTKEGLKGGATSPSFCFSVFWEVFCFVFFPLRGNGVRCPPLRLIRREPPLHGVCWGILRARQRWRRCGRGPPPPVLARGLLPSPPRPPRPTGLCWREGVYRCLRSVRARVGTSSSTAALPCPPAWVWQAPPRGECE